MKCNYLTYIATSGIDFFCYIIWIVVVYATGSDAENEMLWWGMSWLALSLYMTIGTAFKIAFAFNMAYYYDDLYGTSRRLLSKHGLQLIILD